MKRLLFLVVLPFLTSAFIAHGLADAAEIDPFSMTALYVMHTRGKETLMRQATAFVVSKNGRNFLITNWHVVTGRDPETGKARHESGKTPDSLTVLYHVKNSLNEWKEYREPLFTDDGKPRWIEHKQGKKVDVVALPLTEARAGVMIYSIDPLANTDVPVKVGSEVFVIGFPCGRTSSGNLPIWKAGHIATEPDADVNDLPTMWIDAATRQGMSGSPVVVRGSNGKTRFIGVYSGQTSKSELGLVWKAKVIEEILEQAER